MDTQGSSFEKPLAEVHVDVSSEGTETDKASHDSPEPTEEVHIDMRLEGMLTDKASQDGPGTIEEVHVDVSSEGTFTDKAFQESFGSVEGSKEIHSHVNSEDEATDKAAQDVMPMVKVKTKYRALFEEVVKGKWKAAEEILNRDHAELTANIMIIEGKSLTVLDVAIMAAQDEVVENLVKRFPPEYKHFKRALNNAVQGGRIRMVKALADKVDAKPKSLCEALGLAVSYAPIQKEVIWYLARRTTSAPKDDIITSLIMASHLDIVLYLAGRYPGKYTKDGSLLVAFTFVQPFHSGARLNFWEKIIYKCIPLCLIDTSIDNSKDTKMAQALMQFKISLWNLATKAVPFIKRIGALKLSDKCSCKFVELVLTEKKNRTKKKTLKPPEFLLISNIVLDAASHGIFEIVKLCLEHFPELLWEKSIAEKLLKQIVKGRHVELFRLLNTHNIIPQLTDSMWKKRGLMDELVKESPEYVPADVSGAAFVMQRELHWFKLLDDKSDPSSKILPLVEKEFINEGRRITHWEEFVDQRKDLLKEARQWMKDTSSSCSLIATLIITVAFAAAFTVPGGNDGSTGIPIFLNKASFMVFAAADALALFFSITATLMFLTILTSRYAIEDFLHSLPRNMILGLTFLFLSLAFMLVAFGSALTIVLSERLKWIHIPITLLAAFPVILFAILQLPLYVEIVESTFQPRLYRPLKLWN